MKSKWQLLSLSMVGLGSLCDKFSVCLCVCVYVYLLFIYTDSLYYWMGMMEKKTTPQNKMISNESDWKRIKWWSIESICEDLVSRQTHTHILPWNRFIFFRYSVVTNHCVNIIRSNDKKKLSFQIEKNKFNKMKNYICGRQWLSGLATLFFRLFCLFVQFKINPHYQQWNYKWS